MKLSFRMSFILPANKISTVELFKLTNSCNCQSKSKTTEYTAQIWYHTLVVHRNQYSSYGYEKRYNHSANDVLEGV